MKKKNNLIILLIVSIIVILFLWLTKKPPDLLSNPSRLVASKLASKINYFDSIVDIDQRANFRKSYLNTLDKVSRIKDQIEVVGERAKIVKDSTLIEMFVISRKKENYSISFFNNLNDVVKVLEYQTPIVLPDFPIFCNAHYFF